MLLRDDLSYVALYVGYNQIGQIVIVSIPFLMKTPSLLEKDMKHTMHRICTRQPFFVFRCCQFKPRFLNLNSPHNSKRSTP
jgi:hypothetical protein